MPNREKGVLTVVGVVAVVDLEDGHLCVEVDASTVADALHDCMQSDEINRAQYEAVIARLESGEFSVEMR